MQQKHAPRPLPLFLELVRMVSEREPQLAAKALQGLASYENALRAQPRQPGPVLAQCGAATIRDHGGAGPPAVLVPSLFNPPGILDLDSESSLADAVKRIGRRTLLVDWGKADERRGLSISDHVETMLVPLLREIGEPAALAGYCLGGTMAMGAANLAPVERVVTLAAPWNFDGYPQEARNSLDHLWTNAGLAAGEFGALPMEVLQSAFWSLDPRRTVAKFARFAELPAGSPDAKRFVTLEDWANEGDPLPFPAARELIEDFFGRNLPGSGAWRIGAVEMTDRLACPLLNITASNDRITPAAAAPAGAAVRIQSGHVGMVVGSARARLHQELANFLGG